MNKLKKAIAIILSITMILCSTSTSFTENVDSNSTIAESELFEQTKTTQEESREELESSSEVIMSKTFYDEDNAPEPEELATNSELTDVYEDDDNEIVNKSKDSLENEAEEDETEEPEDNATTNNEEDKNIVIDNNQSDALKSTDVETVISEEDVVASNSNIETFEDNTLIASISDLDDNNSNDLTITNNKVATISIINETAFGANEPWMWWYIVDTVMHFTQNEPYVTGDHGAYYNISSYSTEPNGEVYDSEGNLIGPSADLRHSITKVIFDNNIQAKNCVNLFSHYENLLEIENLERLKTGSVKSMASMFDNCLKLCAIDLSAFDTNSVKSMTGMFHNCESLTILDLENFNTINVTNMAMMFDGCTNLQELNLSSFNTEKVINMDQMFLGCRDLEQLDISTFNTRNVAGMGFMFSECNNLKCIFASDKFVTSNLSDGISPFGVQAKEYLFHNSLQLVGGNGTHYSSEHTNFEYARIDTADTPGYFTKIDTIETNEYIVGKDNWSFKNPTTTLSYDDFKLVLGETRAKLYEKKFEENGKYIGSYVQYGFCYGLSSLAQDFYESKDVFKKYFPNKANLYEVNHSDTCKISNIDMPIPQFYKIAFIHQFTEKVYNYRSQRSFDQFESFNDCNKNNIDEIRQVLKNKKVCLVSIANQKKDGLFNNYKRSDGHNVLAYDYYEDENYGYIKIYDPNYPEDKKAKIKVDKEGATYTGFNYNYERYNNNLKWEDKSNDINARSTIHMDLPCSLQESEKYITNIININNKKNKDSKCNLSSKNKKLELTSKGDPITLPNPKYEQQMFAITLDNNGNIIENKDDYHYYFIPKDDYTIENNDNENIDIHLATDYSYIGVESDTLNKCKVTIDDDNGNNKIDLFGETGDDYKITYFNDIDTFNFSEITIEGNLLDSELNTRQSKDGIEISKSSINKVYCTLKDERTVTLELPANTQNENILISFEILNNTERLVLKENGEVTNSVQFTNTNSNRSRGGSSGGGGGGGGLPMNNLVNQAPTITTIPIKKTISAVIDVNTYSWSNDPVTGKWKLNTTLANGQNVPISNGFFLVNKTVTNLVNNIEVLNIVNDTYYFDESGNMVTGWIQTVDLKWYFFENAKTANEGKMQLGWKQIQGIWYYFGLDGAMYQNTVTPDGFIVDANGAWVQTIA